MYVGRYVCLYVCMYVSFYVCLYVCMYAITQMVILCFEFTGNISLLYYI